MTVVVGITRVEAGGKTDVIKGKLINGLFEYDLGTKKEKLISNPNIERTDYGRLSPDGKYIAFVSHEKWQAPKDRAVYLTPSSSEGREIRIFGGPEYEPSDISWTSDSQSFIFNGTHWKDRKVDTVGVYRVFLSSPTELHEIPLVEKFGFKGLGSFGWLPDQSGFVFAGYKGDEPTKIYWSKADGSEIKQISDLTDIRGMALSPKGDTIVFNHKRELFLMNIDGSNIRQLTNSPQVDKWFPYWSPDGKWVLYEEMRGRIEFPSGIHCINVETGRTRFLIKSAFIPQWWDEPETASKN